MIKLLCHAIRIRAKKKFNSNGCTHTLYERVCVVYKNPTIDGKEEKKIIRIRLFLLIREVHFVMSDKESSSSKNCARYSRSGRNAFWMKIRQFGNQMHPSIFELYASNVFKEFLVFYLVRLFYPVLLPSIFLFLFWLVFWSIYFQTFQNHF